MFQNSKDIHILTEPENPRPYLILIRAGSNPRPSFFKDELPADREYDVGVNYYAPPHTDDLMRTTADAVFAGGLSKLHGAKLFFEATKLHEVYEGVFFLDDDIEILFDPNAFFAFCREFSLDLAQPALTPESTGTFAITLHHPGMKMRTTNFVEIMAPFLKRDFLKEMLHSFDLSISGWGIDIYWGHHLGKRWTAAIVDDFTMRHTKPVDVKSGAFYEYLRSMGIHPREEMNRILEMIGTDEYLVRPLRFVSYTYRIGK